MGRDIQLSALYSPSPAPSIPCFNAVSICSIRAPWLLPKESLWQCPSSRLPLTGRWKAAGSGGCCWQPQPHGQRSIFTAKPPAAWATRGLGWQPFNRGAPWSRTNLGQEVSETFIRMVSPLTPSVPHAGQSQPPRTLAYRTGWQDRHSSL